MKNIENNELLRDFGAFIRRERERREMTQTEVAELVEMHQTYYGKIELGKRVVDLDAAIKICKALNLDLSDFIKAHM